MSGNESGIEDEIVLVFRPPENPAAQVAGITPFKGLRLRVDELLDWFKDLNVDSIELWIEGAWKSGNRTELYLSLEGKTGAKVTIKPFSEKAREIKQHDNEERPLVSHTTEAETRETRSATARPDWIGTKPARPVTAYFSPEGGIERQILSIINGAARSIEMTAYRFTNPKIATSLLDAIKRGVKVALVLDRSQTKGLQARLHDELEKTGTTIRLTSPGGMMNDKFMIVDGSIVEWGSYNYTERAEKLDFGNATFLSDEGLAQQYHSAFLSIFNRATPEVRGMRRSIQRFLRSLSSSFDE